MQWKIKEDMSQEDRVPNVEIAIYTSSISISVKILTRMKRKKGGLCQRGVGAQSTAPVIDVNVDLKYANRSAQQPYPRTRVHNSFADQRLVSISHFAVEK